MSEIEWFRMDFTDEKFTTARMMSCVATLSFEVRPHSRFRSLAVAVTFTPDEESPTHDEPHVEEYALGDLHPTVRMIGTTDRKQDAFLAGRVGADGKDHVVDWESDDPADHAGTVIMCSNPAGRFWSLCEWAQFLDSLDAAGQPKGEIDGDLSQFNGRLRGQFDSKAGKRQGKLKDDGTREPPREILLCTKLLDLQGPAAASAAELTEDDKAGLIELLRTTIAVKPVRQADLVTAAMVACSGNQNVAKKLRWANACQNESTLRGLLITKNADGLFTAV